MQIIKPIKRKIMKIPRFIMLNLLGLSLTSYSLLAQDSSKVVQKFLKENTKQDFKVISNTQEPLKDVSIMVLESPSKERVTLLVSKDGSYIIPLTDGIAINNGNSALRTSIDGVNKYNKDMKDSSVLTLFKKHSNSVLKIESSKPSKETIYMVLDTTCPYCLQEVMHLDDYLKEANLEVLMVGILGQKAHNRAAGYYQELQGVKNRDQKIALLKKVFRAEYAPKVGNNDLATRISEDMLASGVQGVPYIIRRTTK